VAAAPGCGPLNVGRGTAFGSTVDASTKTIVYRLPAGGTKRESLAHETVGVVVDHADHLPTPAVAEVNNPASLVT